MCFSRYYIGDIGVCDGGVRSRALYNLLQSVTASDPDIVFSSNSEANSQGLYDTVRESPVVNVSPTNPDEERPLTSLSCAASDCKVRLNFVCFFAGWTWIRKSISLFVSFLVGLKKKMKMQFRWLIFNYFKTKTTQKNAGIFWKRKGISANAL